MDTTNDKTHQACGITSGNSQLLLSSGLFGVKYVGKKHTEHLINSINKYYPASVEWNGGLYCGVTMEWNYTQ